MNTVSAKTLENLKLISIGHYVFCALSVVGLLFIALGGMLLFSAIQNPELGRQSANAPDQWAMGLVMVVYSIVALMSLVSLVLNFMCAHYMKLRKRRGFCIIISAINCASVPLGTILGVFTIVMLSKSEVIELFEQTQTSA